MKKLFYPIAAIAIITGSAFTAIRAGEWKIADNYSVKFISNHPAGTFSGLKGTIVFDEKNLAAASFDVTIDASTINTGNGMQNTHAKGEQWFDVAKYPVIKFTANGASKSGAGYSTKGILDMHGVQKEVTIAFTFNDNVFAGGFEVNRLDYNLNPSNDKAEKQMKIELSVPVTKG